MKIILAKMIIVIRVIAVLVKHAEIVQKSDDTQAVTKFYIENQK